MLRPRTTTALAHLARAIAAGDAAAARGVAALLFSSSSSSLPDAPLPPPPRQPGRNDAATPREFTLPFVPTCELHRAPGAAHVGRYAPVRAALDEAWHGRYSEARQALQDGIVDDALRGGRASARPWLVLTAGPMGAGKSYTMRWLAAAGAFPRERFVLVNPDAIKSRLPEMPGLVAANRALAGSLTHKESGYIAELIERAAAAAGKHILVDGSLRNADWHERMLARLRVRYPAYRVAILLVTAAAGRVYARAERRARVTGRDVPRAVLDEAIAQVPGAYARLAPLADFTAVIVNDDDGAPPVFAPPASLEAFAALFLDPDAEVGGGGGGGGGGNDAAAAGTEACNGDGGAGDRGS